MKDMLEKERKVLNVNLFFYLFIFFTVISCSSKKLLINKNQIDVLNEVLYSSNYNIYYKTIINDLNKPIKDYIINDMEFQFCKNAGITSIKPSEIFFFKKSKTKNFKPI